MLKSPEITQGVLQLMLEQIFWKVVINSSWAIDGALYTTPTWDVKMTDFSSSLCLSSIEVILERRDCWLVRTVSSLFCIPDFISWSSFRSMEKRLSELESEMAPSPLTWSSSWSAVETNRFFVFFWWHIGDYWRLKITLISAQLWSRVYWRFESRWRWIQWWNLVNLRSSF